MKRSVTIKILIGLVLAGAANLVLLDFVVAPAYLAARARKPEPEPAVTRKPDPVPAATTASAPAASSAPLASAAPATSAPPGPVSSATPVESSRPVPADGPPLAPLLFAPNSSQLIPDSVKVLLKAEGHLRRNPGLSLAVAGHAFDGEEEAANVKLSRERADSARKFLISLGVDPGRIRVEAFGRSRPAQQGTSALAAARNRRVELAWETTGPAQ